MKREAIRDVLGRPGLHVMLGLIFLCLFLWPLVASKYPSLTWYFLYAAWALCVLVLRAISRGNHDMDDPRALEAATDPVKTSVPPSEARADVEQ